MAEAGNRVKTTVVDIERIGEKLIVPEKLSLEGAIKALQKQQQQEEQVVVVNEMFHAFPFDGAYALQLALIEKFGWVSLRDTPSFFGPVPPAMLTIEIGHGQTVQVPWGQMNIPGIDGYLETGVSRTNEGRFMFALQGEVKRKSERLVKELGVLIRKFLREQSLYKGKAFRIRFLNEKKQPFPMPEPHFLDLAKVQESELVLPADVDFAVATSIFTPVERTADCRKHGIPLKRGVLMVGPYGVGKTMAAYVTAKKADRHGWTFVYCEAAAELPMAIRLAQDYSPGVVFCEDIDRVASGDRTVELDHLLNVVDGIDSKDNELLVVLTTNEVDEINQALLRPGRLDAVIEMKAPDAQAAERLVRNYGRGLVEEGPLTKSSPVLAGQIPAVIREVVERSKLSAIRRSDPGAKLVITDAALHEAAQTMQMQLRLLQPKAQDARSDIEKAADRLAAPIAEFTAMAGGKNGNGATN